MFPFANGADPNIPWQVIQNKHMPDLIENGFLVKADTIEELAKKLELPVAQLKATVTRHNELYLDFLLALKDEDSLLSHGASLVISSMGSCC